MQEYVGAIEDLENIGQNTTISQVEIYATEMSWEKVSNKPHKSTNTFNDSQPVLKAAKMHKCDYKLTQARENTKNILQTANKLVWLSGHTFIQRNEEAISRNGVELQFLRLQFTIEMYGS